jgi:exodeoxyribonuclease V beta subunit
LYKQQGVFDSRAALEVGAVLRAIHAPAHETAVRSLGLATRLLQGDEEALETLRELALSRRWARMIRILSDGSGASARMVGSVQGDRQWMDLRQVLEFALEYLLAGTGGLTELVEHLGRLKDEREKAAEDRNMLASATDRGRVQILTMHVSKGLEFPVVFLASGGRNQGKDVKSWIEDTGEGPALRMMPGFLDSGTTQTKDAWQLAVARGESEEKRQRDQEERRLFYVAITRPKLLLVVPCHEVLTKEGALSGNMPALGRAVHAHLAAPAPGVALLGAPPDPVHPDEVVFDPTAVATLSVRSREDLVAVDLPARSRVQTSYTQVAKTAAAVHGLDGRLRRSEEADHPELELPEIVADGWLPRGAKTGDALHEILEDWMDPSHDNSWLKTDPLPEREIALVARTLALHGLDGALAPRVAPLLASVLRAPLRLPTGNVVRLCEIEANDRRPETEFHWAFGPDGRPAVPGGAVKGWMVGYIDLLFRVDKFWYVLDWKTTSLGTWNPDALTDSVVEHSYDLQAKLYGRTVASALPAGEAFGGAVVLYLRAFADLATSESGAWIAGASEDGDEIARRLRAWLHERGRYGIGGPG